jgi:hypothetical protein
MPSQLFHLASVVFAVDKHRIAGIIVIVVGAAIVVFGVVRLVRRLTGAGLVLLAGAIVLALGILIDTHTIHG